MGDESQDRSQRECPAFASQVLRCGCNIITETCRPITGLYHTHCNVQNWG